MTNDTVGIQAVWNAVLKEKTGLRFLILWGNWFQFVCRSKENRGTYKCYGFFSGRIFYHIIYRTIWVKNGLFSHIIRNFGEYFSQFHQTVGVI